MVCYKEIEIGFFEVLENKDFFKDYLYRGGFRDLGKGFVNREYEV